MQNENQQTMQEEFLKALEDLLGIQHTKLSISEEWKRTGPEHLRDQDLAKYLAKVYWAIVAITKRMPQLMKSQVCLLA